MIMQPAQWRPSPKHCLEHRNGVNEQKYRSLKSHMGVLLHSLHCELVGSHWDAVHELHGAPETMELNALVHVHHAVAGQRTTPDGVIQEASNACKDDLEHGQTTAQPLFGQKVAFTRNGNLLKEKVTQDTFWRIHVTMNLRAVKFRFLTVMTPSWTHCTCGVPRRSINGTICSAVYLASNRFILASRRSPSRQ